MQRILTGRSPIGRGPLPARPPYLAGYVIENRRTAAVPSGDLISNAPSASVELDLAGFRIRLGPSEADALVAGTYDDRESLLAMHRFAWISVLGPACDPAWVGEIWVAWMRRYGADRVGWAWHPYTASERLINLLYFAAQYGLPGPREETLHILGAHGGAIYDRLEYFGTEGTGNHLANNGRGLFLGGLWLGYADWVEIGERILLEEAVRLFTASGLLREGSSHYHLLVTRWYLEAWLFSHRHGRASASRFESIAARALAAARHLNLPGGFPFIGDISPDCKPEYLTGLTRDTSDGWLASLREPDVSAMKALSGLFDIPLDRLAEDGWMRIESDRWAMLAYAAPNGWHPMPGHAHHDFGGFELHHGTVPVICDLGRGSYEESGSDAVAASSHATLTVDGRAAYPINRPYYADAFRSKIVAPPYRTWSAQSASVEVPAFPGVTLVGKWRRTWTASSDMFSIVDRIEGHGRHAITRYLQTTLPVATTSDGLAIGGHAVAVDGHVTIRPSRRWTAYGRSEPATSIKINTEAALPWQSTITIRSPR